MPGLTALVLGSAKCLDAHRDAALNLFTPDLLIACNHAGRDHDGPVDHWATMHPELMPLWLRQREREGRPAPGQIWYARHRRVTEQGWKPVESWGGSSGLLCVAVALDLGCDKVVLAGVPLLASECHYNRPERWDEAQQYRRAWEQKLPVMRNRVKSMGGWTENLLGFPTRKWIDDRG